MVRGMTRSDVWQDEQVLWRLVVRDKTHLYVCYDLFLYVTWLMYVCDLTHSYVRCDLLICAIWPIHTCDMTHPHVLYDTQVHTCRSTLSYAWHDVLSVLDGYCSTVQGLLDWFEVDLGFTELSFIQIDLCVLCVSVLYSHVSLSSCHFWTFCTASSARWECL